MALPPASLAVRDVPVGPDALFCLRGVLAWEEIALVVVGAAPSRV